MNENIPLLPDDTQAENTLKRLLQFKNQLDPAEWKCIQELESINSVYFPKESLDKTQIRENKLETAIDNPNMGFFLLRVLSDIEVEAQRCASDSTYQPQVIEMQILGSIGSGKTYFSSILRKLFESTNTRLLKKYGVSLGRYYQQWDKTEQHLMGDILPLDESYQDINWPFTDIHATESYINQALNDGELHGQKLSSYQIKKLQQIIATALHYQIEPFSLVDAYPEYFMIGTMLLLQLLSNETVYRLQNSPSVSTRSVPLVIIDAVTTDFPVQTSDASPIIGGTVGSDAISDFPVIADQKGDVTISHIHHPGKNNTYFFNSRSYFGLAAYELLMNNAFIKIDPERVIHYGLIPESQTPFLLTAIRMSLMMAHNTTEALQILEFFGIKRQSMTDEELANLKRGGMFTHLKNALDKVQQSIIEASKIDSDGLLPFIKELITYINTLTGNPFPEYLNFSDRNVPPEIATIANKLAILRATVFQDLFTDQRRRTYKHQIAYMGTGLAIAHYLSQIFECASIPETHYIIANNTPMNLVNHAVINAKYLRPIMEMLGQIKQQDDFDRLHDTFMSHISSNLSKIIWSAS
jgi:hypothetical protein